MSVVTPRSSTQSVVTYYRRALFCFSRMNSALHLCGYSFVTRRADAGFTSGCETHSSQIYVFPGPVALSPRHRSPWFMCCLPASALSRMAHSFLGLPLLIGPKPSDAGPARLTDPVDRLEEMVESFFWLPLVDKQQKRVTPGAQQAPSQPQEIHRRKDAFGTRNTSQLTNVCREIPRRSKRPLTT